jgi:hypothetical protein
MYMLLYIGAKVHRKQSYAVASSKAVTFNAPRLQHGAEYLSLPFAPAARHMTLLLLLLLLLLPRPAFCCSLLWLVHDQLLPCQACD